MLPGVSAGVFHYACCPEQHEHIFRFPFWQLALPRRVTLSACSSTPADQQPSTQTAPGTTAPISTPKKRKTSRRRPVPVAGSQRRQPGRRLPSACRRSLTLSSALREPRRIQSGGGMRRQLPALQHRRVIMPGEYPGTVRSGGAGRPAPGVWYWRLAIDVKISEAIDSEMDINAWRRHRQSRR